LPEDHPISGEQKQKPHKAAEPSEDDPEEHRPYPPGQMKAGIKPERDAQSRGKREDRQHQAIVAEHDAKIAGDGGDRWQRFIRGLPRLAKKDQNKKEHGKDAKRSYAIDVFDAEMPMGPGRDQRAAGAAEIHDRVVNRVTESA